jgi:hypothetical protein
MKEKDPWHYARNELAKQILSMFESGLSSSFVFFAPRRMGKTEFLRKDIQPLAESKNWNVLYFSFLDATENPAYQFKKVLEQFIAGNGMMSKIKNTVKRVRKVSAGVGKLNTQITFEDEKESQKDIKELLRKLSKKQKALLLMDEVQILAENKKNEMFVAGFRTALDMYKDNLKVIFTGSSQAGLRKMFSEAKAPFFHFGQNLAFPELDKGFTDHLCKIFKAATSRNLDDKKLWKAFEEMYKIPLLARSLVERMALNPGLALEKAKAELITEIFGGREFEEKWKSLSPLEKILLKKISQKEEHFFSVETRKEMGAQLNTPTLLVTVVQAAIKKLIRSRLIGKTEGRSGYFIDDPNFKNWLISVIN